MANLLNRVLELEGDREIHPVAGRILLATGVVHGLEPPRPLLEVVVEGVDGLEVSGLALDRDRHAVLLDGLEPDIIRKAVREFLKEIDGELHALAQIHQDLLLVLELFLLLAELGFQINVGLELVQLLLKLGGLGLLRINLIVQIEVVDGADGRAEDAHDHARDGKGLSGAFVRVERSRLGGRRPRPGLGQGLTKEVDLDHRSPI